MLLDWCETGCVNSQNKPHWVQPFVIKKWVYQVKNFTSGDLAVQTKEKIGQCKNQQSNVSVDCVFLQVLVGPEW